MTEDRTAATLLEAAAGSGAVAAGSRGPTPKPRRRAPPAQAAARPHGGRRSSRSSSPPHEYATVRLLVDLIIPKDERSGSATDAGVPEFMDFMMIDQPARQTAMRGGLAWLDRECQRALRQALPGLHRAERTRGARRHRVAAEGRPELAHGVAFFNSFRDLTASGFFTSKMGIEDLQYMGNRSVARLERVPGRRR